MELQEIKGIGAKRVKALNEMGIFTPSDLLLRFPDKYIYKNAVIDPRVVREGDEISFAAKVSAEAKRSYIRKGLSVVTCSVVNNGTTVRCSWFNQPFAARSLKIGDTVYVCGKVKKFKSILQMTNPAFIAPQEDDGGIIPVYKTAIPSRTFASAVRTALENVTVNSYIPRDVALKFNLLPLQTALTEVHMPTDKVMLSRARRCVAIENMCYVITSYRLLKDDRRDFEYGVPPSVVEDITSRLTYELTHDQKLAVKNIISEMRSDKLMNALVQGEVGCGKTVVALIVMYYAAKSGHQATLMAPTETLARQHYENAIKLLEPLGVNVQLLCASMNKTQTETALFNIKYGVAQCIIGTQSLISDGIEYNDLRLVIVDEQQRFGVNQRAKLESKGKKTDMIVMTATPIPRTLALSLYGELSQTDIRTIPKNRPSVQTSIVPPSKFDGMFKYIETCASRDERTYIICPRIADDDDDVTGVDKIYAKLKSMPIGKFCGCLHGKMRDAEKNSVMKSFKNGEIKVLVSTTVVEVGIDVPEATNVIVYDAERFGLAQLHQIRGRVGRGTKQSYCFLISENGTPESDERLKKFCGMRDGFSVSELDFELRGAGDFVGLRQHGNVLELDKDTILCARELSDAIINDGRASEGIIDSLKSPEFIKSVTMN